jgi:DNA-binding response OmpR family regulator
LLQSEGDAVSRERLLDVLRQSAGREVEAETVSRRALSLRRALAPWKGKIETVRGGFYRLVSSSRRRSTT